MIDDIQLKVDKILFSINVYNVMKKLREFWVL